MGNKHKHHWIKSTNHKDGKQIYTLHLANDQGTKQFKTAKEAKEAKDYVDKNWPLNKELNKEKS